MPRREGLCMQDECQLAFALLQWLGASQAGLKSVATTLHGSAAAAVDNASTEGCAFRSPEPAGEGVLVPRREGLCTREGCQRTCCTRGGTSEQSLSRWQGSSAGAVGSALLQG